MTPKKWSLFAIGTITGLIIAAVDNFAFKGEVSPIVIVTMLFTVAALASWAWGWNGVIVSTTAWLLIPAAHIIKLFFGLPDTLQPNTYASILMLAIFTLLVAAIGTLCGLLLRKFSSKSG